MLAGDFVRPACFESAFKIFSSTSLQLGSDEPSTRATHLTKEVT